MALYDEIKKMVFASVGAMAITIEKSGEIIEQLVKKGEITVEQGKILNEELKHSVKEAFDKASNPPPTAQEVADASPDPKPTDSQPEPPSMDSLLAAIQTLDADERAMLLEKMEKLNREEDA